MKRLTDFVSVITAALRRGRGNRRPSSDPGDRESSAELRERLRSYDEVGGKYWQQYVGEAAATMRMGSGNEALVRIDETAIVVMDLDSVDGWRTVQLDRAPTDDAVERTRAEQWPSVVHGFRDSNGLWMVFYGAQGRLALIFETRDDYNTFDAARMRNHWYANDLT